MTGSQLAPLLARVEAAEGPDRYIDFWATVLLWDPDPKDDIAALEVDIELVGIEEMWVERSFSASLDAALALCERVLPRAYAGVQQNRWPEGSEFDRRWCGYVNVYSDDSYEFVGKSPTPALALLAAMLKAKIAETGQ